MGHNESGVIEIIKETLRSRATELGKSFKTYPLGGQDRYVLADDIFAVFDNFAIIESKWSEDELSSEVKQKEERVKRLCLGLQADPGMAAMHEKCHKIAWRDSGTRRSMVQSYRSAVCKEAYPQTCVASILPFAIPVDDFANDFFGQPPDQCLPADQFLQYANWLVTTITGATDKKIIVLASSKDQAGYAVSDEVDLRQLGEFLKSRPPVNKRKSG